MVCDRKLGTMLKHSAKDINKIRWAKDAEAKDVS